MKLKIVIVILFLQPERLQGTQYTIRSDVWSMGLSLVELALGRYPIPSPRPEDYEKIFSVPPYGPPNQCPSVVLPGGKSPPAAASGAPGETKSMAIFELLDYIVNEVISVCLFGMVIAAVVSFYVASR